eukprot:8587321-Ditylum_brightwellii.AAC.1
MKLPPPLPGLKMLPRSDPTWKNLSHDIQIYKLPKEGKMVVVKWDNKDFYIDTKCSVSTPKVHPVVSADCMHIPTRLIPMEEREILIALADGCVGSGIGRNFLNSKLGKYISNTK